MQVSTTYRIAKFMAGAALIALMASQGMAQEVVEEDTTVWAGGDPNFDESAGGEVIEEPIGEIDPEVLVDPVDGWDGETIDDGVVVDGGGDCIECFNIGDGDGSEGSPIVVEDSGVDATPARGGVTELGGASPEVLRGDAGGKTPGQIQAESNASEDNADCVKRVGRSQAHRCMN